MYLSVMYSRRPKLVCHQYAVTGGSQIKEPEGNYKRVHYRIPRLTGVLWYACEQPNESSSERRQLVETRNMRKMEGRDSEEEPGVGGL